MADEIRSCGDLDERLAAYVDGEDPPPARRVVEQHLQACPACGALAQQESAARDLVRAHRDALCAHAPDALKARCAASLQEPTRSRPPLSGADVADVDLESPGSGFRLPPSAVQAPASMLRSSRLRQWVPLSLAATLVLAIAGVFVFGLNDRVQALAASLAVDHVKCFKVNGTVTDADAHASERAWQDDQGWPIVVPQTDPAQQLKLVGVRRCLSSDGRVAHMMYTWHGEPLSVYVLQADAGRDEVARTMGAQEIIWRANRRTYAVVSGDTTRDLAPILDYIKVRVQ